ncbi:MAG: tRNA lysidine(34) synthetase TilS [Clostridia bacterium]|nr:tRNA lysidine(34) synthetase TilS [Clostridia bacterium]
MKNFKTAQNTVKEYEMVKKSERVLVALSGGPDSVYLFNFLLSIKEELELTLFAAHVNHNLRKDEAKRDEEFCRELCKRHGVELFVLSADVESRCRETGEGTEEAARNIRYGFFERVAAENGIDKIALGHNADDFVETVIFNFIRGAGSKGLCGIPAVREKFIRPLIDIPKSDIESELTENGIEFMTDRTNLTDDYTRNKIRHNIVPVMKEINPSLYTAVKRTSKALAEDNGYLMQEAAIVMTDDVEFLNEMPKAISFRVIFAKVIEKCGFTPDNAMISRIRALLKDGRTSKKTELKNGYIAKISYGKLVIERESKSEGFCVILNDGENRVKNCDITLKTEENTITFNNSLINITFKCGKIVGELTARSRREGDRIRLHGVNRSVKKLFIDEKIPCSHRDEIIIITDAEKILFIENIGVADCCEVK